MKIVSLIKGVTVKVTMAFASILMVMMAALMVFEVVLRWFFGLSTMVSTDFSAWAMGVLFYLGASKAMDDNTFVRMDIIYDFFKGRFKKIIDIVFDFVILFFNLTITYWFFFMLRNTFARNLRAMNMFETPLWIPRLTLFIGIVLFNVYLICRIIEDIRAEEQTHSNAELREMKS